MVAIAVPVAALAQTVAWQAQVTTQVPAGDDVTMANAALATPPQSPTVALVLVETDLDDRYQYRAIATDPADGSQRWSTDLGPDCETRDSSYELVVPMPGGDAVVVVQGVDQASLLFSCVRRLSGVDGHVVWSNTLHPPGLSLNLYAMQVDAEGHLVAAGRKQGNALVMRMDADTGSELWQHEIVAAAGTSLRAIAAINGSGDRTVVHLLSQPASGDASLRLVGLSTSAGTERWNFPHCVGGLYVAYQSRENDVRLRMLADGTVEFASKCVAGQVPSVELGRLNALTGAVVWQRTLSESNMYSGFIDVNGFFHVEGKLRVDGIDVDLARLDPVDGALIWSLPQTPIPAPMEPYVSNQVVVTDAYVHVLERYIGIIDYVTSATVATYAASNGQLLGRAPVNLPPPNELAVPRSVSIGAFGDGDVLVATTTGANRRVGSRLLETRLRAVDGTIGWTRQTPIMAPHPLVPLAAFQSTRQMSWNDKGTPGIVLAGRGINPENYDYPRIAKLARLDGRVLWRWEPDKRVRGNVVAALGDEQGDLIVAGSNGWDDPPLLLAKLNGVDGSVLWEQSAGARPALDATLDAAGSILLALGSDDAPISTVRVARYSAVDGQRLWEVPIQQGYEGEAGENRILAQADGSVVALSPYSDGAAGQSGMQVAKFATADGSLLWLRRLPGQTSSDPATPLSLPGGDLVVASRDLIWRVNGATGAVQWQKSLPQWTWSVIVDAEGQIMTAGAKDGLRTLARLNASNGAILWARQLPLGNATASSELASKLALASDGNILVAGGNGYDKNVLAKLAVSNGATLWELGMVPSTSVSTSQSRYPVGILESTDHNVYFGGLTDRDTVSWTLVRVTGSFADGIFGSGFD